MDKLLSANDPVIVKRQYLKPVPPDPEFENMTKGTGDYQSKVRQRKCVTCSNPATQMLCSDLDGIILTERYCDNCIKENKHIPEKNELMSNFDSLFTRAPPQR